MLRLGVGEQARESRIASQRESKKEPGRAKKRARVIQREPKGKKR